MNPESFSAEVRAEKTSGKWYVGKWYVGNSGLPTGTGDRPPVVT
ncbi:hypothetical protein ACGH2B_00475 [Streptomyces sp. BBFR2]